MSATASPAQPAFRPAPLIPAIEIEASCRAPLLVLFGSSVIWLLVALVFGFIASLKFHNPHFLASDAYLTYGRVHAANVGALLYGFAVQAGLGAGLWFLCRLGRSPLVGPFTVLIGASFWNFAVTVGLGAILCGDSTGYDSFEMPGFVSTILLASFIVMALCGLLTYRNRAEGDAYPSQWFVLGSFFWFPWIFSTATALLLCGPVRGVVQSSVAWWYAHNLSSVVLGMAGLGSIFYFLPKLLGRPLRSAYLAAFAFWTLALFGSWGGIPNGAPLPSWIVSLSTIGTVLTAMPVLAVALNLFNTARNNLQGLDTHVTLRFTYVSLIFWIIAEAQQIVGALPHVSMLTDFTLFSVAHWKLFHYGFFTLAMFGAIYYIVPRLLDWKSPPVWSPRLVKLHFWLMLVGVLVSYLSLLVGGIGQGMLLNDRNYSYPQVMAGILNPLRSDTMGDVCLLIGTLFFLLNLALLVSRHCYQCCAKAFVGIGKERL